MKTLLLLLLVLTATSAVAQTRPLWPETRAFTLKPIEMGGGAGGPRYFYDGKRLGSNPESLQVPFLQLADGDVLRQYRKARTLTLVGGAAAFAPLALLAASSGEGGVSTRTFVGVCAATVGVSMGFVIGRNFTLRRAVRLYNERIAGERYGQVSPPRLSGERRADAKF
ncbi:MAG: hypothetical protein H7Y12_08110 [Sphingobacteriaceae bacterium]|nr:hypothetical protein [Cytophagaceae bacterium]